MQLTDNPMINRLSHARFERWIYLFIFLHLIIWTLAPAIIRQTLPMDAIEGAIWGQQLEWGYDKNPFMNGWLTALAVYLGNHSDWLIYLFSQLSVAAGLWAVWQLSKKIVPPIYAFAAVLSLEGIQYFNLHAIDFNDNTLEIGFWALTCLFFYQALQGQKLKDWILTGVFAGLSTMIKYYSAMLLLPMFLFMLVYPQTRAQFKRPYVYVGLSVALAVIAPHIFWLFSHDFSTIHYAFNRISSAPNWINHFHYPVRFAKEQFEVFFPTLLLLLLIVVGKTQTHSTSQMQLNSTAAHSFDWKKNSAFASSTAQFDKVFLLFIGFGPFILTVLLSAFTGIKLRAGWGQPLLTFWALTLLAWIMPTITRARFKRFMALWLFIFIVTPIAYCTALVRAKDPSSANFPGKRIAQSLANEWHDKYHTPLMYVVGPRWLAGNIAFYSTDHPHVYIDAEKQFSPWINEENIRRHGALFVWDPAEDHQMSRTEIQKRFGPQQIKIMHFTWLRNLSMQPIEISVAFLPPAK